MRKILVVNLTRFGDLLQTGPTITGLRAQHPAAEITVLAERNFVEVCHGMPDIDHVRALDLDALGRSILADTGDGLRDAYRFVEDLLRTLRAERFDLALNYSSSRMSAVLLGLLQARETRGWTMTGDAHRLIAHDWSRLFAAMCLSRRQAPFNLVDSYKRVAGVRRGPRTLRYVVPEAARAAARARLAEHRLPERTPLVAFQLGASRAVRRWPAAHFVAVGRTLVARLGARVILCGGGGERPMADEIAAALGPAAIDTCGRTSIAELAALLQRADVLLTGDTGPMHLAVAVGTPVVALFFGPALPFDTGPYAQDHLCLHAEVPCGPCDHSVTCLDPFCRDVLAPDAVAEAVIARRERDWRRLGALAERSPRIGVYRTGFDPDGFFDVTRLGPTPASRGEQLRRAYRTLWKTVLEGVPPSAMVPLDAETACLRTLGGLAREATRQAVEVEHLATGGTDLARLDAAARRLEELDLGLFRFGAMHEPATLLVQVFRFEKENLEGDDVGALARATRAMHEELERRTALLAAICEPVERVHRAARHGGEHASPS